MVYLEIEKLFDAFLKEKQFLCGASPATVRIYSKSWSAYKRYAGCVCELTDDRLKSFTLHASQDIKPGSVNAYARGVDSFLTWLHENGHVATRMRVPLTSVEKRVLQTYTPEEAKRIITHKPTSRTGKLMMALLYLLIDTGARVSEALSLTRKAIDFENLLVTLKGKGNKQRRIPISLECRKRLYQWLAGHDHDLVFCTNGGGKLHYDNVRREFLVILRAVKVEKTEGSFHAFRRYFGKQYIRGGGNPIYLQRVFGHSSLQMTPKYVDADEESLQMAHKALSPLKLSERAIEKALEDAVKLEDLHSPRRGVYQKPPEKTVSAFSAQPIGNAENAESTQPFDGVEDIGNLWNKDEISDDGNEDGDFGADEDRYLRALDD